VREWLDVEVRLLGERGSVVVTDIIMNLTFGLDV
jgi:hypothetical protein